MEFNPTDPTRLALINSGVHGLLSLEILDIAQPNKVIKRLQEDQGQFTSFAWSPDGKKIAVTFSRRGPRVGITGVKVLDAITYKVLFGRAIGGARGLDWSPDGKQLAITITVLGGFNGPASSVEIWNEELKKRHKVFGNTGGGSPDWGPEKKNKRRDDPFSSRIAMGNRRGGTVTIVEVGIKEGDENKPGDLQELTFSMPKCSNAAHEFDLRNRAVGDKTSSVVAWSADGKRLARGSQRDVIIWDSDNLNVLHEFKVDFPVNSLAWRSDGRMIAAGNNSGSVRVFKDIK
jgi:WD40 repeat protein